MKAGMLAIGAALAAVLASGASAMDLSKDIVARGAKPDWSLKVERGVQFTLARPGKPLLQATAPGASMSPGAASWSAKTVDGQALKVSLQTRSCTAGGRQYPMAAQVVVGGETLAGCAGPTP